MKRGGEEDTHKLSSRFGVCILVQAALAAISSPLLDVGIDKATGVVWNITGPPDMTLFEVGLGWMAPVRLLLVERNAFAVI